MGDLTPQRFWRRYVARTTFLTDAPGSARVVDMSIELKNMEPLEASGRDGDTVRHLYVCPELADLIEQHIATALSEDGNLDEPAADDRLVDGPSLPATVTFRRVSAPGTAAS